jgi:ABC-type sulfate transport system substrate-binding protein
MIQAVMVTVCSGQRSRSVTPIFWQGADVSLLNVSYDPTREFYQEFNAAFAKHWKAQTGDTVTIGSRTAAPASRHAP